MLEHFKCAGHVIFFHDNHVIDFDLARGFDGRAGDRDASMTTGGGGQAASLENARRPKPFVHSHRVGRHCIALAMAFHHKSCSSATAHLHSVSPLLTTSSLPPVV